MKIVAAVALGGALGSLLRHLCVSHVTRLMGLSFPWGTLLVNILGCFSMGLLVELAATRWNLGMPERAFLTTGLLGGFTTFSAFSLDVALLYERGQAMPAAAYIAASVLLSIIALFAGLHLVRAAWL